MSHARAAWNGDGNFQMKLLGKIRNVFTNIIVSVLDECPAQLLIDMRKTA